LLAAVSRGSKGLKKGEDMPGSLTALKGDLLDREKALDGARGFIDKSSRTVDNPIDKVYFRSLPTVGVADITIRYYSPKK